MIGGDHECREVLHVDAPKNFYASSSKSITRTSVMQSCAMQDA